MSVGCCRMFIFYCGRCLKDLLKTTEKRYDVFIV